MTVNCFLSYILENYLQPCCIDGECRHISNILEELFGGGALKTCFKGKKLNTNPTGWLIFRTFFFYFAMSRGAPPTPHPSLLHTSALLVFLKMSDSHPPTPLTRPPSSPSQRTVTPLAKKKNLNDVKIIISQII